MITVEATIANGAVGRLFAQGREQLPDDPASAVTEAYADEDDLERRPLLAAIVSEPMVRAVTYPTHAHRDVLQVFLRHPQALDQRIFACVVVSVGRLRQMLRTAKIVIEGFSLQVTQGEHLTQDGVRAAIESWIERTFPGTVLPQVYVEPWTGPDGLRQDTLQLLLEHPQPRTTEGPLELSPDPRLAEPPYEDAA